MGVVPTAQALEVAREAGLDLVEVAAQERPPVCKVMDYSKFKFELSQKAKKSKGQQQKLKEIRVRPKTGEHDVQTKVAQARKFLAHGDRVQVYVIFRGREMQYVQEGRRVLESVLEQLADVAKVERPPLMEGKRMVALLAPKGERGPGCRASLFGDGLSFLPATRYTMGCRWVERTVLRSRQHGFLSAILLPLRTSVFGLGAGRDSVFTPTRTAAWVDPHGVPA